MTNQTTTNIIVLSLIKEFGRIQSASSTMQVAICKEALAFDNGEPTAEDLQNANDMLANIRMFADVLETAAKTHGIQKYA